MAALRILILCVTASLICASIRTLHPQIASVVALGCGAAALAISAADIAALARAIAKRASGVFAIDGDRYYLLRMCGIALVAELASDICTDSGETALARRIDMGVKLAMAASALPMAGELMDLAADLLT